MKWENSFLVFEVSNGPHVIIEKLNAMGEEGAKKFDIFMGNLKKLIQGFLVWKIIGEKIFKGIVSAIKNVWKTVTKAIRTIWYRSFDRWNG